MNEVLLTNVFFIITGSAILVVVGFLCVALFHLIKILRTVRTIVDRVSSTTELFVEDARVLRDQIASGAVAARLFATVMSAIGRARPKRRTPRKQKEDDISSES